MSVVGGGSDGGGGAGGTGNDVAQELAEVKAKIEKLETAIEEQQQKVDVEEAKDERRLMRESLGAKKQWLVELQKEKNRLAEQQREQQAAQGGGDTKRRKLEIRELAEDDPVVRFWKALCEVKEEVGDSGAEVLRLPDGVFWGGDKRLGSTLVVRQCYKDLFQLVSDNDKRDHFVVTGTPGIGKSFFALYWLWRVANMEGGSAIYETGRFLCRLFVADAGVEETDRDGATAAGWFDDIAKRVYLVDLVERAGPYHQFRGKTVVFCPPDDRRYHEFIKQPHEKFYMPLWSDDELKQLRAACFPNISLETMVSLTEAYGNVPRHVLALADKGLAPLEDAVNSYGRDVKKMLSAALRCAADDDKTSYKLLHLVVDPDSKYAKQHLGWASQYVVTRLLQVHEETMVAEVRGFAAYGKEEGAAFGALRGHLFEGFAHRELAAGRVETPRRLDCSSTDADAAELRQLLATNRGQKVFSHLVGEELAFDALLMPKARNLESLDSLLISSDGDVVLFSVTVSKAHGAKVRGLREAVQAAAQALTVAVRRKILLFVVPEDLVPAFGKQKYGAQGGAEWKAAWPQELAGLEQWVVGIKLA